MIKWHGEQAKQKIRSEARKEMLRRGYWVEARAKENISRIVYETPESPNYLRTGLAWASIHTVERNNDVLVGADANSFKNDADRLGVDIGSGVFYLPYIEKGHLLRNGSFYPARPFLVPALDALRHRGRI